MIKPYSEFHRNKLLNPKVKRNMEKITVEEALLFAEWANERFERTGSVWMTKDVYPHFTPSYTTRELWNLYQAFLGKKTP
jgi:hypothetical protein